MFHKKKIGLSLPLIQEIERTQKELESVYLKFEDVLDPDLIDSYIYEVNALQKRYKFLIKQARALPTLQQNPYLKSYISDN